MNERNRKSIRLKDYDYTQEGAYYVTVCTQKRECLFGDINDGKMILNEYGMIIQQEWCRTEEMRKNIDLDKFMVMPNHIHGIINIVGAHCNVPLHDRFEKFGRSISNSIPTIIKLFKSTTAKQINLLRNTPGKPIWQRGFYEHIIRDKNDFNRVRQYITNNPDQWAHDKYFESKNEKISGI